MLRMERVCSIVPGNLRFQRQIDGTLVLQQAASVALLEYDDVTYERFRLDEFFAWINTRVVDSTAGTVVDWDQAFREYNAAIPLSPNNVFTVGEQTTGVLGS